MCIFTCTHTYIHIYTYIYECSENERDRDTHLFLFILNLKIQTLFLFAATTYFAPKAQKKKPSTHWQTPKYAQIVNQKFEHSTRK